MPLPSGQFLPSGAKVDLAKRQAQYLRGGAPEVFKEAAKETYDNPLVNAGIGFAPVLGDIQAAGETVAALRRGAPWQETAGYAAGMLPFVPMIGKTVWHGSPHTFDKFDLSKIGTGEGAQAYGHGLYLADAPEVAGTYKKPFSSETLWRELDAALPNAFKGKAPDWADEILSGKKIDDLGASLKQPFEKALLKQNKEKIQKVIDAHAAQGNLYKVDLPDEQIAKMLDWDKPLSEQPESVRNALTQFNTEYGELYPMLGEAMNPLEQSATTGQTIYNILGKESPANASKMLRDINVPGIQYLDQASRKAGEGTRNYVVFDDQIPQILERNGNPVANALREQPTDYRGHHTAPSPEFGAPLHDLTGGGQMYPEDVYSSNAARFYGHGGDQVAMDRETIKILQALRNQPDAMVDIFRAVPNDDAINAINKGDWVTVNPNYAKTHGESQLEGNYKVLSQKVPAKSVWTNADSIHEFGYYPE